MSSEKRESICTKPCDKSGQPKEYVVSTDRRKAPRGRPLKIGEFVKLLSEFKESELRSDPVADFLRRHTVELDSLSPFALFQPERYTRNLIFQNDRLEIMLLCWDVGRSTPVHNHDGQSCWVYVQSGKLSFTNYRWLGCDRSARTMHLEEISRIPMAAIGSMNVIDERDAIHRLGNDASFNERAISLHVYARPLKTCVVYDETTGTCFDRTLSYYSIDGVLV